MSAIAPDAEVERFLLHHADATADPAEVMRQLCTDLLASVQAEVPVDVRILASAAGIAEINHVDQQEAGCIFWRDDRLVVHVRAADPAPRQRFTVCHEICHTFFPDFSTRRQSRTDTTTGEWKDPAWSVEYLCDVGAAELLMPSAHVRSMLTQHPVVTPEMLAAKFESSIAASTKRLAQISP